MTEKEMDGQIASFFKDLAAKQEDLPPDMAKILYDNLWDLYEE